MITEVSIFPFQVKAQNYAFFYCTPPLRQKYFLSKIILRDKGCKILLISMVLKNPRYLRPNSVLRCWTLLFCFLNKNGEFICLLLIISMLYSFKSQISSLKSQVSSLTPHVRRKIINAVISAGLTPLMREA
jgi:hypothetical protein